MRILLTTSHSEGRWPPCVTLPLVIKLHLESIPSLSVCVHRDIGNTELISISASIIHFLVLYCQQRIAV